MAGLHLQTHGVSTSYVVYYNKVYSWSAVSKHQDCRGSGEGGFLLDICEGSHAPIIGPLKHFLSSSSPSPINDCSSKPCPCIAAPNNVDLANSYA